MFSELMISDMKLKMDPKQYGNQKGLSVQHYLIDMIHRILTALDSHTEKKEFCSYCQSD